MTGANDRITLFVAFNYGGRAEIVDAARTFTGGDEEDFRAHLYAPDMHDPDLIIRTSGELRISNYLMWQSAYSELVFRDELWPDFTREALRGEPRRVRRPPAAVRGPLMPQTRAAPAAPPAGEIAPASSAATRRRSDLLARIFVAIPAAVVAIVFIDIGGLAFALFMIVIGCVCLSELYRLLDRWRPVTSSASRRSPGWCWRRGYGNLRDGTRGRPRPRCRPVPGRARPRQRGGATVAIAGTLLGIYWIGFAFAHAVLLARAPVTARRC